MTAALPTQEQVNQVAREFAPAVVRIRFKVAPDWSEHPAIYFRVLLADPVSRGDRLADITGRVRAALSEQLGLASLDHLPYFRFRSQSEQAKLKDSVWE